MVFIRSSANEIWEWVLGEGVWVVFIGNSCRRVSEVKIRFNGRTAGWLQGGEGSAGAEGYTVHMRQLGGASCTHKASTSAAETAEW